MESFTKTILNHFGDYLNDKDGKSHLSIMCKKEIDQISSIITLQKLDLLHYKSKIICQQQSTNKITKEYVESLEPIDFGNIYKSYSETKNWIIIEDIALSIDRLDLIPSNDRTLKKIITRVEMLKKKYFLSWNLIFRKLYENWFSHCVEISISHSFNISNILKLSCLLENSIRIEKDFRIERLNPEIALYILGYPFSVEYDKQKINEKLKYFLHHQQKYIFHIESINKHILESEIKIMKRFCNNIISVNDTSTLGDSICLCLPNDIYIYKNKSKIYRFVKAEFNFIKNKKLNPYTMENISDHIIYEMERQFCVYSKFSTAVENFNFYLNPKEEFNERNKNCYNSWYEYYVNTETQEDSIFDNLSFSDT